MAKSKESEVNKLKKENAALRARLDKSTSSPNNSRFSWKTIFKWASISLAGALFVAGSIIFYVGMTLTNTDRFMEVASPLIRQPAVQQAVAQETTQALFEQVDTQQILEESLPPKLQFLSPQISSQVQELSTQKAEQVLASPSFQNVWDNALRTTHSRLIDGLKNYEGNGTITLNDVYQQLSTRLVDTKLSFLAGKSIPSNLGSITVIQSDYLPTAHRIVANMNLVRILTILAVIVLLSLSVYLSKDRRKGTINVGVLIGVLSLSLLIAVRIGGEVVANQVQSDFKSAASETWAVLMDPYRMILWGQMLFGFSLAFIAWIGGRSKSAVATRSRLSIVLEGKLHQAIFKGKETSLTNWFGKHKNTLLILVSIGFICSFLFIAISATTIVGVLTLALLVAGSIIVLANPKQ